MRFYLRDADRQILDAVRKNAIGDEVVDLADLSTDAIGHGKTGFFEGKLCCDTDDFGWNDVVSYTISIEYSRHIELIPGDIDKDGRVDYDDFF